MVGATAPTTVRIERITHNDLQWYLEPDSNIDLEDLHWVTKSTHELTIENRGISVRLAQRERLVWGDKVWYGLIEGPERIDLRVWHDGSITEERY